MKDKKYPYLVEQMYYHLMTQGSVVSKQFVFDYLKKESARQIRQSYAKSN